MAGESVPTGETELQDEHVAAWEARLAAAVLRQALLDASGHGGRIPEAVRSQARAFLRGSESLRFWCERLALPVDLVVARAASIAAEPPRGAVPSVAPNLSHAA